MSIAFPSRRRPACAALFLVVLFAFGAQSLSAAPDVHVRVDDRFPVRVLALFEAESVDAAELDAIVGLPGARALLRKVQAYAPEADEALLREALRRAHAGEVWDDDPFYFWHSRRQREKTAALLASFGSAEGLGPRVAEELAPYLPDPFTLDTEIILVLGGASAGWTLGDGSFQIGLDHHADDSLAFLEKSAAHELYHVAQESLLPEPAETGRDDAAARVDALLRALVMEGTASLLDDYTDLEGDGKLLATLREKQRRNRARLGSAFVLFETLVFRAAHDPGADLAALYELGFLDPWGSSAYEVGRSMAEAIVAADGSRAIPEMLRRGPRAFVRRYIELSRSGGADGEDGAGLHRFGASFEGLILGEGERRGTPGHDSGFSAAPPAPDGGR